MSYRDDHDALHGRVDELERDLGRARQELAENREARAEVERLEKELAKARAKIERLQPREAGGEAAAGRRRLLVLVMSVSLVVTVGAVFMVLAGRRGTVRDLEATAQQAQAEAERRSMEAQRARQAEEMEKARRQLAQETERLRERTRAKAAARAVSATWRASVKEIRGRPVRVGAKCTLTADLTLKENKADANGVVIRCGAAVLYNPEDAMGSGNEVFDGHAEPLADGQRYRLKYTDRGTWTGPRAQVSVDTAAKVAEVWSDNAPRFRAVLKVDEVSAPAVVQNEAAE